MQFNQSYILKTNITSSLDLKRTNDKFSLITRQLSKNSSKYIYRLELYEILNDIRKVASIDVYETYDESKHFVKFIADRNELVVSTKFQIKFYKINYTNNTNNNSNIPTITNNNTLNTLNNITKITLQRSIPHNQKIIYSLQVSADGQLVSLIGQNISMFRTNGYRRIQFPHIITSARHCSFSFDNKYLTISTNTQINIYRYTKQPGEYLFIQFSSVQINQPTNFITSTSFSPIDSDIMIIGYLNISPQLFRISSLSFQSSKDIQPLSANNAKVAVFMNDGKRFISSDYRNGVGVWPGVGNVLLYEEGLLLYDLKPLQGSKFIGYVWQQVKIIDIQVECKPKLFLTQCECTNTGSAWDYSTYSCRPLLCGEFSTGEIKNNQCICIKGYKFNQQIRKCILDCSIITHAVTLNAQNDKCYCKDNYTFNIDKKICEFDCNFVSHSTGVKLSSQNQVQKCQCKPGFVWSVQLKQCVCPKYSRIQGTGCVCYQNYFQDTNNNNKCIIDCSKIVNSNGSLPSQQQCQCNQKYFFTQINQITGCKLNCSLFKNTIKQLYTQFQSCPCVQNTNWDSIRQKCRIDCMSISYASGVSSINEDMCNCAVNYLWVEEINQCGKNCTGILYIDPLRKSTLRSCPCIQNFNWNVDKKICQIDCRVINNTSPYSLINPTECECRMGFNWVKDTFKCRVDCQNIWQANVNINDDICKCNKDMFFDSKSLTCNSSGDTPFFSNVWMIVGFVLCLIVVLMIIIVLAKYCWQFKTKDNKEHAKRLKSNDNFNTKKKIKSKKENKNIQENQLISDQRLKNNIKI